VCDTIEGLRLAYYELHKIDKRLVISIVLHLTTLSSTSVMECLHGKTASYNLLEGIFANAVRGVTRALIGGGCVYSYIRVLPDEFLLNFFVFKFISKEISRAEHEYMNLHTPPN
jgi:hypothetical protein